MHILLWSTGTVMLGARRSVMIIVIGCFPGEACMGREVVVVVVVC